MRRSREGRVFEAGNQNEMAKCKYCGAETVLYISGAPVCVNCSNLIDAGKKPPGQGGDSNPKRELAD
jgi:hypothetical protein